jgi:LysM repeat protein
MSLVNGFQGQVNSLQNSIRNPFETSVTPPFDGNDFADGMEIQELLPNGSEGERIVLIGNLMPKIPFKFGGTQRIKKEFYAGYSEPTMHVLGPEETDITINGEFKDKRYTNRQLKNIATEFQKQVDAFRIRGNIVKIRLGEFERFAIISTTSFEMERLSKIRYAITFSIIGLNAPRNARFLNRAKEVPFAINKELLEQATNFQAQFSVIPDSVPRSVGEQLNALISDVAGAIATVTGFIDQIVSTVQDIQKSVERAKGLIKYAQNKLRSYKRIAGSFQPFNSQQALTGRYESAKFYSASLAGASALTSTLQRLKARLAQLAASLPLGRHLVVTGDTLQKIAIKFYGSPDNWKRIYDFNNLQSTDLQIGRLLEIPRL